MLVEAAGVKQALGEVDDVAVEPRGEIAVRIEDGHVVGGDTEARDGDEAYQHPVTDKQDGADGEEPVSPLCDEADETGAEIAEGDPREDAVEAEVGVVEVGVEAEEEIDSEDDGRPAEDVKGQGAARFPSADAGLEREDDGGADDEEEVGEDEVGKGETVPFSVVQLRIGVGPVTGIIDQDHEGDGDSAKDVDGEDARWG